MEITAHTDAAAFLGVTQAPLEREEAANNLMLGIALRLTGDPQRYGAEPAYLATAGDQAGLAAAALQTPPYNIVVFAARPDAGEALAALAQDLLSRGRTAPGVLGPAAAARAFAEAYARARGCQWRLTMRERAYELRQVNALPYSPGELRPAGEAEQAILTQWLAGFKADTGINDPAPPEEGAARLVQGQDAYLWWHEGQPVSLAARSRRLPHGIAVGPVYTPPEQRRRGYATACVAALSRRLLNEGWQYCCLFTDLANPTSNDIYQQIGYRPLCDYEEYRFS